ncbi:aminoacyl-tRNA hydrolase [Spartinivicinus marinus]|uniref:aminoacyl-tRNA hydrolase n=1 Tax=Spartinivicinus marinus TaxID=2994442 RepID=UPI003EC08D00
MQLVVGLGNPGAEYEDTRHNAGAMFVEMLARRYGASLRSDKKFSGELGQVTIAGQAIRLLIPTTYMNLSGQAVGTLANFYKIPPQAILVAHDELDIPPGTARYKQGGGHGGHNGLRDIIAKLGNCRDFARLRIGIGHPGHSKQVVNYVLSKPPQTDQQLIDDAINTAIDTIPEALTGAWSAAVQQLHSFKAS